MKAEVTERVSHAYFRRGDYVFRQGDPAQNFYAVEKGELEVIRKDPTTGSEQIVALLGPRIRIADLAHMVAADPRIE